MSTPTSDLRRFEPVTDTVVLATIERAERHEQTDAIPWFRIMEHLGFIRTGWATRNLRPQVDALTQHGLLERSRRHSSDVWGLTSKGRQRLAHARRAGEAIDPPEAPQHREWRQARTEAGELIDGFREQLGATLKEATELLASEQGDSDAWFALAQRLDKQCDRLGKATYCLYEWAEPNDAQPDRDDYKMGNPRHLRRNRSWKWEP